MIPKTSAGAFKARAVSTGTLPLHAYLVEQRLLPEPSGPSLGGLALTSNYQTGAAVSATQIRLSLPILGGATAADQEQEQLAPVPKGTPVAEEFPDLALPHSLHLPTRLYQPTLQFASESFYDFDVDSSNYSVLAGDPPEFDEGSWVWKDTNGVTLLAENVAAQASEQTRTFWSGVLLGVAGAGGPWHWRLSAPSRHGPSQLRPRTRALGLVARLGRPDRPDRWPGQDGAAGPP